MAHALKDVFLKVFLYLLDVVSDWLNGAEQITGLDFYNFFKDHKISASNKTIPANCFLTTEGPTLGLITIGLSWLPGILTIIFCTSSIAEVCQGITIKSSNFYIKSNWLIFDDVFKIFSVHKTSKGSHKNLDIPQLCILAARFVVWPIYVPFQM